MDSEKNGSWQVYLVRCADGSYYTGISTDVDRRVVEHNSSKRAARYTRVRRPVELVWCDTVADHSTALKYEARIKRMSRKQKEKLIAEHGE